MGVSWSQTATKMCDLGDLSGPWPARMDSVSLPGRTSRLAVCLGQSSVGLLWSPTFAAGTDPIGSFCFRSVLCNHWSLLKIIFFDVCMAPCWCPWPDDLFTKGSPHHGMITSFSILACPVPPFIYHVTSPQLAYYVIPWLFFLWLTTGL